MRRTALALHAAALLVLGLLLAACGDPEVEGPELSYSTGRDRWSTGDVEATVTEARGVDGVELSLQIDARHPETGENLTFLAVVAGLEGEHAVQVFGRLAGFDRDKGYERLLPVSSACSAPAASAVLSVQQADTEGRRLAGTFLVHVCGVESDHTWTLGEGRFSRVPY